MSNYGLAIHTASASLGLALSNFAEDNRTQVWDLGRETSNVLHQYLIDFLAPHTWDDLSFLAVAKGPGGFTGTRIGVVTARTLAQQLDLPLFALSTLAGLAWQAAKTLDWQIAIAIQLPAQRGEVFAAIYQVQLTDSGQRRLVSLLPDAVLPEAQWQATLDDWASPYHLVQPETAIATSVTDLLELAHLDWQQGDRPDWSAALPFYGQHPVER
ncbi:MAG: tRNA (adenosine(37)-N6)-threonylcarbamoyltransferase complex dimerization subunit type 1 TsaB [Leptolyngbyaceae cyanobacterium bins.349]|nr:tRNA (adenosine(37)-N6)-threonylcarbamoyltransferase complex dimerization subunit type 1 TsaB [Leptolyngbyaceae cyanobacterium bins.349]